MIYRKLNILPRDPRIPRYYQEFEYMFIFSKGKPLCNHIRENCKHAGTKSKAYSRNNNGELRLDRKEKNKDHTVSDTKVKGNVWDYAVNRGEHPAPFPEKLAEDHILSWSNEGDTVLDPMAGSGTTLKMAKKNNRNYIGIEISKEYIDIINKRLS
jgi:site-specific DNA-methyltransferase (adenine-specific)